MPNFGTPVGTVPNCGTPVGTVPYFGTIVGPVVTPGKILARLLARLSHRAKVIGLEDKFESLEG